MFKEIKLSKSHEDIVSQLFRELNSVLEKVKNTNAELGDGEMIRLSNNVMASSLHWYRLLYEDAEKNGKLDGGL